MFNSLTYLAAACEPLVLFGYKFAHCAKEATFEDVLGFVLYLAGNLIGLGALVAVLFIIISGLQLIYSGGNEETSKKAKSSLLWAIIGFVVTLTGYIIVATFLDKFAGVNIEDLHN